MLVTHISAAAGSLAWVTLESIKFGKPSALGIATGMVAGLGTITPASGFVGPGGALLIGGWIGLQIARSRKAAPVEPIAPEDV